MMDETAFLQFLTDHKIHYDYYPHEAVFTIEEADRFHANVDAMSVKNLFLCNADASRHYIYSCPGTMRTDLKLLSKALGETRMHFATEDNLSAMLGIGRGSVTPMAVINDARQQVSLLFEQSFWQAPSVLLHPLVNTASIVLTHDGLLRFLKALHRTFSVIKVDGNQIRLVDP